LAMNFVSSVKAFNLANVAKVAIGTSALKVKEQQNRRNIKNKGYILLRVVRLDLSRICLEDSCCHWNRTPLVARPFLPDLYCPQPYLFDSRWFVLRVERMRNWKNVSEKKLEKKHSLKVFEPKVYCFLNYNYTSSSSPPNKIFAN
jgi:hypothetical protein